MHSNPISFDKGFEKSVDNVASIEKALGIYDLAQGAGRATFDSTDSALVWFYGLLPSAQCAANSNPLASRESKGGVKK